ncbi:MAG: hypothetical protein HKN17_03275, partial [Rhodothermales bacterium]|nr:hypothetical protein [Rhodothermales bacterium]
MMTARRRFTHVVTVVAGIAAIAGVLASDAPAAMAQETSSDWAWKDVVRQDSVAVQYIFYTRPEVNTDGVVLKLVNRNPYAVEY